MHIVTDTVHADEPCWGLREAPELRIVYPNGGQEKRWIQKLFVIRDDAIAKYETDFGPAEDFAEVPPLIVPSFGENSVAQLQELAERHRHDDKWGKRRKEMLAGSTLIADILRNEEILLEIRRNRSQFGPALAVERNDYPQQAVERRFKEVRDAKTRRR